METPIIRGDRLCRAGLLIFFGVLLSLRVGLGEPSRLGGIPESSPSAAPTAKSSPSPSRKPSPAPSAVPRGVPTAVPGPLLPPQLVLAPTNKRISEIVWDTKSLKIETVSDTTPKDTQIFVRIRGTHTAKTGRLLYKKRILKQSPKGLFELRLPLTEKVSRFEVSRVDHKGNLKIEPFEIHLIQLDRYKRAGVRSALKRWSLTVGISLSTLWITAPRVRSFVEFGPTLKVGYTHLIIPPSFDIGASAYFTLFGVAPGSEVTARFLGINARAGYVLPWPREPWRISLLAGWYYVAMFGNPPRLGFTNVSGPQIFPTVRYRFGGGQVLLGYFKFSPIASGLGFMQLTNREVAGGGAFVLPRSNGHVLTFSLDVSDLTLNTIRTSTLNLGFGYGF